MAEVMKPCTWKPDLVARSYPGDTDMLAAKLDSVCAFPVPPVHE
jgi:hypothetical protein